MAAVPAEITEALSTAIVVVDADLRTRYLNPAAEDLFAVSARSLGGRPAAEWLPATIVERAAASLSDGRPWTARELPLAVAGGAHGVTVDVTLSPSGDGGIVFEFSALDRHLRISREEQLHSQDAASRALVRGLAHEIKNPLGGLRGAAQLLDRRLGDAALREYTSVIIAEADRLGALVDAMLGPTRPPQHREVNIHEITERVATLVEGEYPSCTLRRAYDPSLPPLHADPDQLVQALLNLVRNAAQAAEPGGTVTLRTYVDSQVTIGRVRHRQVICVDVIDDGPGIPPDMVERIFLPLVSTRDGGSGLGLSIAQGLVTRHGGLIECTSEPGRTVFTMLLPRGKPADE